MVYKFLNEYLAKLAMLTASQSESSQNGMSINDIEDKGDTGSNVDKSELHKFTPRSSVSSIFDFNDKEKIEKQIML